MQDINNFRPISLLSIFDKIIEKLMHIKLYQFLEDNDIIYTNQYGFKKHTSTTHAITEKRKYSIEAGKVGVGIFIDLKKAFDTVNHDILLMKFDHYGVRGTASGLGPTYLIENNVFFNGHASEQRSISCGVPQGSVLGPLLFLIYINDLPNFSDVLKSFLFADDTEVYYEDDNLHDLEFIVNKELKGLHQWLSVNRLAPNISKTNFVIFHPYNRPLSESITLIINKKAITEKTH